MFQTACLIIAASGSTFKLLKHQRAVGAAKAERIGNRHINGHISRFVGAIIQIAAALDILLENIDGGR